MDEFSGIVSGLFGLTPQQAWQQQHQQENAIAQQAYSNASGTPGQLMARGYAQAGSGLVGLGAGMMGVEPASVVKARKEQTYLQGVNLEDPASIRERANQITDPQYKLKLGILANAVEKNKAALELSNAHALYYKGLGKQSAHADKQAYIEKVFGKASVAKRAAEALARSFNLEYKDVLAAGEAAAQREYERWIKLVDDEKARNAIDKDTDLGSKQIISDAVKQTATPIPQVAAPQSPVPLGRANTFADAELAARNANQKIQESGALVNSFTPAPMIPANQQQGFMLDPVPRNRIESDTDQAMTYAIPDYPSVESTPLPAEQPAVPLSAPVAPVSMPAPAPVVTAPVVVAPTQVEQVLTPKKKAELIRDAIRRGATQDAEDIRKLPTGKPKVENVSEYNGRIPPGYETKTKSQVEYEIALAKEMAKTDPRLVSREAEAKKTGEDAAVFNAKQYEQVLESKRSLDNVANLKKELASSDAITGIGADIRKDIARARAFFGSKYAGKVVSDTEFLTALTGAETYPLIKALGITAQMMNTPDERNFIREVFLGNITLNKDTLLRLADTREKDAKKTIDNWNSRVKGGKLDNFFKLSGKRKEIIAPTVESKRSKKWNSKSGKWE